MGILGLLQNIKACLKEKRLSDYRGQTVAVDTYAWLHKIIKGPSGRDLIIGGPNRNRFVNDCLKRIAKIQNLGIKVIMVFDGGPLPGKRQEEQARKKRREETFAKGKQMLQQGDEAGFKKLVDSIDITPDIAYRLIAQLRKRGVDFIVAPYQADAQLAYLSRTGIADVIITEDSDLMAFGARRMLYKLDFSTMTGFQLEVDQIPLCRDINFNWFTHCMFLTTCILAGCDYLNQISGVGFKTAQKSIGRVTTFRGFLSEVSNKSMIPQDYELNFMKAFLTFRFQRVYCPLRKVCVELNDLSLIEQTAQTLAAEERTGIKWSQQVLNAQVIQFAQLNQLDYQFLGEKYSAIKASRIAEGQIHPVNFMEYEAESMDPLGYVPSVPLRTNSTIVNAKTLESKGTKVFKRKKSQLEQETKAMQRFLKGSQQLKAPSKYDPIQFRSVREGEDKFFRLQTKHTQGSGSQIQQLKPLKGGLRLCEQNDSQSEDEKSLNISYVDESVQQISVQSLNIPLRNNGQACKVELQDIADKLFGQIFTQEYLRNPFTF